MLYQVMAALYNELHNLSDYGSTWEARVIVDIESSPPTKDLASNSIGTDHPEN